MTRPVDSRALSSDPGVVAARSARRARLRGAAVVVTVTTAAIAVVASSGCAGRDASPTASATTSNGAAAPATRTTPTPTSPSASTAPAPPAASAIPPADFEPGPDGSITIAPIARPVLDPPGTSFADAVTDLFAWNDVDRRVIATFGPMGAPPPDPTNRFADDLAAAEFGRDLFFDDRFSRPGALSCRDCHEPALAFADGVARSLGNGIANRNAPTLLDVAHRQWLFWDGRADTLWSQAIEPFEDPREYASTRTNVARLVVTDADLRDPYESIIGPLPDATWVDTLPEHATPNPRARAVDRAAWETMSEADRFQVDRIFANVGKMIAAYERQLTGGPSDFDRFVADIRDGGDGRAHLTEAEARGFRLFAGPAGCRQCHFGPTLSDDSFHATGVPSTRRGLARDPGRWEGLPMVQDDVFNAAGPHSDDPDGIQARRVRSSLRVPEDFSAMRTPSLRHVALTAPYMHAGQIASLEEVVRFYSTLEGAVRFDHHGQTVLVALDLSEQEQRDLLAFLNVLTGDGPDPAWTEPRDD